VLGVLKKKIWNLTIFKVKKCGFKFGHLLKSCSVYITVRTPLHFFDPTVHISIPILNLRKKHCEKLRLEYKNSKALQWMASRRFQYRKEDKADK
jgi:hypothetical protein